jgi:hypothetical protein
VDVEDAVRSRYDLDGRKLGFEVLEDPGRQTGGLRKRPSGDAVLDPDVVAFRHQPDSTTARRLRSLRRR